MSEGPNSAESVEKKKEELLARVRSYFGGTFSHLGGDADEAIEEMEKGNPAKVLALIEHATTNAEDTASNYRTPGTYPADLEMSAVEERRADDFVDLEIEIKKVYGV